MDLIMMGTGDFAVPTFRLLLDRSYAVRLLVTQPDRPSGRHQEIQPAAIKQLALERGIAVFQPESVNTPESIAHIASIRPDLLVVAAYGQILSDALLSVPRCGGINLHASLLPKYRGAAPVNWAIYHGETVTGVTVIQMNPRVDAGAILLQDQTPIDPEETAGELEARLAAIGAPLICQAIDGLESGRLTGRTQDRALASRAPKLKKEQGLIDWTRDARGVCNHIRAMQPWPMPFAFWHSSSAENPERLIIERARPATSLPDPSSPADLPAGSVFAVDAEKFLVKTGHNGAVAIERLRLAGKRSMTCAEFLRGHSVRVGDRLG